MPIDLAQIKGAEGNPVKMEYPRGTRRGVLKSREIAWVGEGIMGGAEYCTVVDVIKFDDDPEFWIRVGYYRQAVGTNRARWAGRSALCSPLSQWRRGVFPAIEKAMKIAEKD